MADLHLMNRFWREGDPLLVDDWNRLVTQSSSIQSVVEREHDAEGYHRTPMIPSAGGLILATGSGWVAGPSYGISQVVRVGTGQARVELAAPMLSEAEWGVVVDCHADGKPKDASLWPCETTDKSASHVVVRLPWEDCDFVFFAFDHR